MSQEPDPFDGRDPREPGRLSRAAAEQLLAAGDDLATRGEFEQAVPFYRRVIGHGDADVHVAAALGLADSLYRLDDEPGALQAWIVAASAPETPLSWKAWKQLAAARVREGDLVAATRAYREAERRAPAFERQEISGRLGWLNKEMGNDRASQRYFGRSRDSVGSGPILTYAIIAATVLVSLFGDYGGRPGQQLVDLLALDKGAVAHGEWYRLVSIVLVHGGALHLLLNMYALFLIGPIIEGLYGKWIYLASYLLAAAAGSTLSFILTPIPAVGASGGIFGLAAMLFVTNRIYKPALARQARAFASQLGMLLVVNLIFGVVVGGGVIDNFGHIGGLLAGAWLGIVLPPRGAITLGSFWQNVGGSRGAPATGGPVGAALPSTAPQPRAAGTGAPVVLLRGAAVGLLVVVVAAGVAVGSNARRGDRAGGEAPSVAVAALDVGQGQGP